MGFWSTGPFSIEPAREHLELATARSGGGGSRGAGDPLLDRYGNNPGTTTPLVSIVEQRASFITAALSTAGDEQRGVRAGEIVVVPPGTPHRFEATGDGTFREIGIHVSPRFVTEWLAT